MIYIAADNPLPLIEWQENVTTLSISELSETEKCVTKQFAKPFVAHAGCYQGCSCGFFYDDLPCEDEEEVREDALARKSVRQFSEYLSKLVKSGSVELFTCRGGDQEALPEKNLLVTPDYFGGNVFAFEEKIFLTIVQS